MSEQETEQIPDPLNPRFQVALTTAARAFFEVYRSSLNNFSDELTISVAYTRKNTRILVVGTDEAEVEEIANLVDSVDPA